MRGLIDGGSATNELIGRNVEKIAQLGDVLPSIAPFALTGFASLVGSPVRMANTGEVAWYADWSDPDTSRNAAILLDDELTIQIGVTTIETSILSSIKLLGKEIDISDNGRFLAFAGTLADGTSGAWMLDRGARTVASQRVGLGINTRCFLSNSAPILGADWSTEVDVTGHPGATLGLLAAYEHPFGGFTLPIGELLANVTGPLLFQASAVPVGGLATIVRQSSSDTSLVGFELSTQGVILGGGPELCNAIDVILGQ